VGVTFVYWTLGYLVSLNGQEVRVRQQETTTDMPSGSFQLCLASGAVYLEFTAYFPSRSGSEVVFLEQAYPRPRWLFPTTFAVQSVILSFGSANATGKSSIVGQPQRNKTDSSLIVMANYLIAISGHEGTAWQTKGTALACYSLATLSK
jgi:hypothetical protein